MIRTFSCVLCLVLNSAVLLKGIRREFAGEGEVRFNLDRSASSSSCPPLCVLSSSGDVVVNVVEVGGVLALLLLLHPLCILRRNKGGGVTQLDREGGVSVWGEIETAKSSKTDSP